MGKDNQSQQRQLQIHMHKGNEQIEKDFIIGHLDEKNLQNDKVREKMVYGNNREQW